MKKLLRSAVAVLAFAVGPCQATSTAIVSADVTAGMGDLLKYGELGLFLADHLLISKGSELAPGTAVVVERILYVLIGASVLVVLMSFARNMIGTREHPISIVLAPRDADEQYLPYVKKDGRRLKPDSEWSMYDRVDSKTQFYIDFSALENNRRENLRSLNLLKAATLRKGAAPGAQDDPT
jgi:hypothetical protein